METKDSKDSLSSSDKEPSKPSTSDDKLDELLDEEIKSDSDDLIPYETMKVKLKWSRILLVATILSIFITGLTILTFWIVSLNDRPQIYLFLSLTFLLECGLLFTFGGCIGTVKQSFTLNMINRRLFKGEKITGADTKVAIGSAYSYILAGVILGLFSLLTFFIIRAIPSEAFT